MANITIKRNVAFVESSMTLEQVKKLAKYRPESLKLKDEKGNPTFIVGTTIGCGSIKPFGVSFGVQTDETKPAGVTFDIPVGVADPKEYVMEVVGTAILNLEKVEAGVAAVNREIDAELASIERHIVDMDAEATEAAE